MQKHTYFWAAAGVAAMLSSCSGAKLEQPQLGTRSVNLIEQDGYQFKDLNKNGTLDPYEDWRLTADERAENLVGLMTLEEKVGFMIISQINMGVAPETTETEAQPESTEGVPVVAPGTKISALNEEDVVMTTNVFTGLPCDPVVNVSATTKGIQERHLRHFILRDNAPARVMAEWSNNVQAVAEASRLGIPAIYASNPRNHVATDNSKGLNVGGSSFTQWPSTLGLGAMNDTTLIRQFAETAAQEWAAVGIRKGYMYQLDLATEPRWSRIEGTFGEDADRVADIARQLVLGFQKEQLCSQSVALTMKHFPGAGCEFKGWDAHYDYGKNLVYPGSMMAYHLKPFQAAIDAGTSAIMPYYAQPKGTKYEEVGFTYNKGIIDTLLRKEMGFKGIINSDTGPINNMPWGVEDLTIYERYQKALEAGTDLFSGAVDSENLMGAIQAGLVSEERINQSVKALLIEKFQLGLFENPYVDVDAAEQIVNSAENQALAAQAFRKSIVLLRNDQQLLPLKKGTKVYMERMAQGQNPQAVVPQETAGLEFCSNIDEADLTVLWLTPGNGSMFSIGSKGAIEMSNLLSANAIDVKYVNTLIQKKPTIVLVNFSRPWTLEEIESQQLHTLLATFGTTQDAVLDVLTGQFNPSGKLPFAIPASQQAVENNQEDVPGNLEPEGYALFRCGFGLSY